MKPAAIGFRAKTGRAIAVAIAGGDRPSFIFREEITLSDPDFPGTEQPYHEVMEMRWADGVAAAKKYVARIEVIASSELARLLEVLHARGFAVKRIGVVGSKDRNLEKLGNPHIRAHAAEGILFRRVLEVAGEGHRLKVTTFSDSDIVKSGRHLRMLGEQAGPPWRSDEKAAAAAAISLLG